MHCLEGGLLSGPLIPPLAVEPLIILTFITGRLKDFPMASAHVHRNAEKLASIRATPRLVNILHAVGAELALRRASWPRSPPRSLSSSPSSNPADNEATKPTDERGNEQTGKARAWKECETRMGRKKKKKIGSRTSLPVMSDANNRARSAGCCARFSPGALLVASGS